MTSSTNDDYQPGLEELISLKKAAEVSGLSQDHLRRLAEKGQIWAKKLGRNWVTTEQAVRRYLAHERRPGPKKSN
jgi:excisionase family DNA binding protein